MKIAQYYDNNGIRLGLIEDKELIPVDFQGDMIDLIKGDINLKHSGDPINLDDVRFAPPVSRPSKIIGIGLNYLDHIKESKGEVPEYPLIFAKFPNTLIGHKVMFAFSWNHPQHKR